MQHLTTQILRNCRQQFDTLQDVAAASMSGIERAQQSALQMCRQAVSQQLEVASRISEQATQVTLDPQQARPAVEGILGAQRELMNAMADTQRRCFTALAGGDQERQGADLASSYAEAIRQSMQHWQDWMQQMVQVTRDQADQMTQQSHQQAEQMRQAVSSATRSAEQQQEGIRRGVESAANQAQQRRNEQQNRSRATESA